jgi:hypothetical protein
MGEDFTVMNRWFNDVGWEADISALRREYPELSTLERYLLDHGWVRAGSRVSTPLVSERLSRSQASWTASSASLREPSIR